MIVGGIIGALLIEVGLVHKSYSALNRETGEIKRDVEHIREEIERLREDVDIYVGKWKSPGK